MLNHKAGLSTSGFGGYVNGERLPTTIQILDGVAPSNSPAVRLQFEPGLKFQYSGGGTVICQLILENATGETYQDYMLKNVLMPLGMNSSSFNQPPDKNNQNILATGYNNGEEFAGKYHVYPEKAPAGLWSNPTDLAKYIIDDYDFSNENELNQLGYELLGAGKTDAAIKIFSLNVAEFPNSANPYDSRGEAYLAKKEYLLSKKDYLKSLELDPNNQNAKVMLLKIETLTKK